MLPKDQAHPGPFPQERYFLLPVLGEPRCHNSLEHPGSKPFGPALPPVPPHRPASLQQMGNRGRVPQPSPRTLAPLPRAISTAADLRSHVLDLCIRLLSLKAPPFKVSSLRQVLMTLVFWAHC